MAAMAHSELSYQPVGIARPDAAAAPGFRVADRCVQLGAGEALWQRAGDLVAAWAVKQGAGFRIAPADEQVVEGRDYATRFGWGPIRLMEPVQVVWLVDEPDRRGFGYGTRPGHPLRGEECFLVERDSDGSVWFRTRTVSRVAGSWWPLWLGVRLAQPIMQARYARSAARLAGQADALPGMRGMRQALVGEGPERVDGIARFGYGLGGPKGPFDEPPAEPVELDADALPWELRDETTPATDSDDTAPEKP